jgi:hypothetical protein
VSKPTRKLAAKNAPAGAVKLCGHCRWIEGGHMPEKVLQTKVEEYATLNGWLFLHINDSRIPVRKGGRTVWVGDEDTSGFPDLLLLHPRRGLLVVRELKKCDGRVTAKQKQWLDAFVAAGVDAGVWRPSNLPDIEATLGRLTTEVR